MFGKRSPKHAPIVGRVVGLQEPRLKIVHPYLRYNILGFHLERATDEGEPLPTLSVELRGPTGPQVAPSIKGVLREGDMVEIEAPRKRQEGSRLEVSRVMNLTTHTPVGA